MPENDGDGVWGGMAHDVPEPEKEKPVEEPEGTEPEEDPFIVKRKDAMEEKFGIRPDFLHKGHPGFYTSENEWYKNMRATRMRTQFSIGSKSQKFMNKNPGIDFFVGRAEAKWNQNYIYPVNRRKRGHQI